MNNNYNLILNLINTNNYKTQREISRDTGFSLGYVNNALKMLKDEEYIDKEYRILKKGESHLQGLKPKNAVILAAGYGMQTTPLNTNLPKAMISIKEEKLIERIISQLNAAGIFHIYIVVGFMKEKFDYLVDRYSVTLVVNEKYAETGSIYSLNKVIKNLGNSYIIPSDLWFRENPFSSYESNSWYMVSKGDSQYKDAFVNKKGFVDFNESKAEYKSIGLCYLSESNKDEFCYLLDDALKNNKKIFWEEAILHNKNKILYSKVVEERDVVEINTFEQLRNMDKDSDNLNVDAISCIKEFFEIDLDDIKNIAVLKKGMTNRSFTFEVDSKKYIMRIPGEGTDALIDRKKEYDVYQALANTDISEEVIYIDPDSGYKISRFLEGAKGCDGESLKDIEASMKKLKEFHSMNLSVNHCFDEFEMIDFYESLWPRKESLYEDYFETKDKVLSLKKYIDKTHICLCHIDSVSDNFLILENGDVKLIDWEYAGMNDPHIDIAMFCIYGLYKKEDIDKIVDCYFDNNCDIKTRIKIYAYISVCGLLWSNWCEYKHHQGIEFGQYSIEQYRYAKEYYKLVNSMVDKVEE